MLHELPGDQDTAGRLDRAWQLQRERSPRDFQSARLLEFIIFGTSRHSSDNRAVVPPGRRHSQHGRSHLARPFANRPSIGWAWNLVLFHSVTTLPNFADGFPFVRKRGIGVGWPGTCKALPEYHQPHKGSAAIKWPSRTASQRTAGGSWSSWKRLASYMVAHPFWSKPCRQRRFELDKEILLLWLVRLDAVSRRSWSSWAAFSDQQAATCSSQGERGERRKYGSGWHFRIQPFCPG